GSALEDAITAMRGWDPACLSYALAPLALAHLASGELGSARLVADEGIRGLTDESGPWYQGSIRAARARVAVAEDDDDLAEGLAPAEVEVARLVGDGLTNKAMAERLFVSPRTVQAHLTHIYARLGMNSRIQLARAGASLGFVVTPPAYPSIDGIGVADRRN